MRLHYYYAVSFLFVALAYGSMSRVFIATPHDAALQYLAGINEYTKAMATIVKANYENFTERLAGMSRRMSYSFIRTQMTPFINLVVDALTLMERNSVNIRLAYSMCGHMYWTVWKWYYLNQSSDVDTPKDLAGYIESLFDRLKEIREYKPNNKVGSVNLVAGIILCSEEMMGVVSNIFPIVMGRSTLTTILQLQKLVIYESSYSLFSTFKVWLGGFELAGTLQTSLGSDPGPYTTDNWDCYQLERAHEMSTEGTIEGLKGLVEIFNRHGNSKYYQPIRYKLPKSLTAVLGVLMSEKSFALPAPIIKITEMFPMEHDPHVLIRIMGHLNDISHYTVQLGFRLITEGGVYEDREFDVVLNRFSANVSRTCHIYYRLMKGSILSSLNSEFKKICKLFSTRALYILPDQTDRESGMISNTDLDLVEGYFSYSLMEMELVGRLHGRESDVFDACRMNLIRQYQVVKTFDVSIKLDNYYFISMLI